MAHAMQVSMHGDGHGTAHPAVNVKVHNLPWSDATIAEHFKVSEGKAAQVGEWAWNAVVEDFWGYWGSEDREYCDLAHYFGDRKVTVYSEGRSGGWLVVEGLPDPESEGWPKELQDAWARFEADVLADVKYRTSWDYARELIEANEWAVDDVECPVCSRTIHPRTLAPQGSPTLAQRARAALAAWRRGR